MAVGRFPPGGSRHRLRNARFIGGPSRFATRLPLLWDSLSGELVVGIDDVGGQWSTGGSRARRLLVLTPQELGSFLETVSVHVVNFCLSLPLVECRKGGGKKNISFHCLFLLWLTMVRV